MEYGWVSKDPQLEQPNGFFVDRQDRIIWWPDEKGPGYYLSRRDAREISHELHWAGSSENALGLVIAGMVAWAYLGIRPIANALYPFVDMYFSSGGLTGTLFWPILLPAIISLQYIRHIRRRLKAGYRDKFSSAEKIYAPRPKATFLKPLFRTGWKLAVFFLLLFLGVGLGLPVFAFSKSTFIGDQVSALAFGALICYPPIVAVYRQIVGVSLKDARILEGDSDQTPEGWSDEKWAQYQQEQDPEKKLDMLKEHGEVDQLQYDRARKGIAEEKAKDRRPGRRIGRLFDYWTSGWRWIVTFPLIAISLLIGMIKYSEMTREYVTANALLARFEAAAFGHDIDLPGGPFVVKWTRRPTVTINSVGNERLTKSAAQVFERLEKGADLTRDPARPAKITISPSGADHDPVSDENVGSRYFQFNHNRGSLNSFDIFINQKALENELPNGEFTSNRTKNNNYDETGRALAYRAYGLWINFSRGDDNWKDRSEERVFNDDLVVAIHYDPRIRPGAPKFETMEIARMIATEIVAAGSFESWRTGKGGLEPYTHMLGGRFQKAKEGLLPLAAKGDVLAQYMMGRIKLFGLDGQKDVKQAVRWFGVSAKSGFGPARELLARAGKAD